MTVLSAGLESLVFQVQPCLMAAYWPHMCSADMGYLQDAWRTRCWMYCSRGCVRDGWGHGYSFQAVTTVSFKRIGFQRRKRTPWVPFLSIHRGVSTYISGPPLNPLGQREVLHPPTCSGQLSLLEEDGGSQWLTMNSLKMHLTCMHSNRKPPQMLRTYIGAQKPTFGDFARDRWISLFLEAVSSSVI